LARLRAYNHAVDNEDAPPELSTVELDAQNRFLTEVMLELRPWHERMVENFQRLLPLIRLASELEDRDVAADILRSVVVLQHAYLEEFIRTVVVALLPLADSESLSGTPLADMEKPSDKFSLGHLAKHRGKTVNEVLAESVREEMGRATFSKVGQFEAVLKRLRCKIEDHSEWFPALGEMMARRHDIVHRADWVKSPDSDSYKLQPIDVPQVERWLDAAQKFMGSMWEPLYTKQNSPDALERRIIARWQGK